MELNLTRPIAFLDLETTGIKVATDRIVEICILKVFPDGTRKDQNPEDQPGDADPAGSYCHSWHQRRRCEGLPINSARWPMNLVQFLDNCDLAGYNSNHFDIPLAC